MNKDIQDYYEARFDMFSSKGWKDLIEDINERKNAINTVDGINTVEMLFARKGEKECLDWLISLPELSRTVYDELVEEDKNAGSI